MKTYQIWKYRDSRVRAWTGRKWQVRANSEEAAIAIGKQRYPSNNPADKFFAVEVSEEQLDQWATEDALHAMDRPIPLTPQQERLMAYHAKLGENKLAALDRNVRNVGLTPAITAVAEKIERDTAAKLDEIQKCH